MMTSAFRMSRITSWSSCKDVGRFWVRMGRKVVWRFPRSQRSVELHRQQNGTAIPRDWSSCLQKHQCFESWNLEAKERQLYHSLQWRFHKHRTLWKSLFPTSCDRQEDVQNSTECRRRMVRKYSSVSRVFEFWFVSEIQCIGSYSRRHHHWTSPGSSLRKKSWRIWHRSCNSINCKPRIHNLRCDIQRKKSVLLMKFMITDRSSDPAMTCSQTCTNQEEMKKVTRSRKETWAAPSTKETGASLVIFTPRASRSFTMWRKFGSVSFQDGNNNASTFWPRGTTTWWFETRGIYKTSIDEDVCSRLWCILVTLDSWWKYQETTRLFPM